MSLDTCYLKNILICLPEEGRLIWKEKSFELFPNIQKKQIEKWNDTKANKEAFVRINDKGYLTDCIDNKNYLSHRIIWQMVYGETPKVVDHINGDRIDNRLSNLRNVSYKENNKNLSMSSKNTTGVVGVYYRKCRNKWLAKIQVDKKYIHLGYYDSFEEAVEARKNGEIMYEFHENHGRTKL